MADVTITVRKNGPYLVSGAVELRDADGNPYPAKETVALCRCGASSKRGRFSGAVVAPGAWA